MDPKDIPTGMLHVQPDSKKQELVECRLDIPEPDQQILDKVKNHGLEHLMADEPFLLIGNENVLYLSPKTTSIADFLESIRSEKFEVNKEYSQVFYSYFDKFHHNEIGGNELEAKVKNLEEVFRPPMEGYCRLIHRGHVAGTSLSQSLPLEGAGNSSTCRYPPGTNACGEGVPVGIRFVNDLDSNSSVKHSPPGKGEVSHEEGAGGLADVSRDAIFSMNGPLSEVDLESGLVKNNADPPAPWGVPSAVAHHTDHTAAGSGEYGKNVPMTLIQVATASYRTVTSKFARASLTSSLATSIVALLLADTKWKAAAPMLAKAGIIVCGVGVLADIGKDLPVSFFVGSLSTALLIITVAILSAKPSA